MSKTKLALIIPCYNEDLVLESTINKLLCVLDGLIQKGKISNDSFIYLVDDGSYDTTWQIIESFHHTTRGRIKGCKFIKNYGNQKALIAGLLDVNRIGCECAITIDADLQQDEHSIEIFIDAFHSGAEVVLGVRNDRKTDSFFKKISAIFFYKLINLLGVKIPLHHSDYRLVSRRALQILEKYSESELFLRGFFNDIGLSTKYVRFNVKPRRAGKSKFNFCSLTNLALNGITSHSVVPLRLISLIGLITVLISFCVGCQALYDKYILQTAPSGWATIVILIVFFGGLQIFGLGVIGEYIGQIFKDVKSRPSYIKEFEIM